MKTKKIKFARAKILIGVFLLSSALIVGCTPRAMERRESTPTPAPVTAEEKQAAFLTEVEKMKTADLKYVFAFRRKDGAAMDAADKKILKAALPYNNRVVLVDEDRAVIFGSNAEFPPEMLDALRTRFNVEDFSPPQ